MADIYVSIWNQDEVAMSSVNGELIVVLINQDGRFRHSKLSPFAKRQLSFRTYLLGTMQSFQDIQTSRQRNLDMISGYIMSLSAD